MENVLQKFYEDRERREALEHRDVLLAIGVILKSKEGLQLFKYLFKSLEVTCAPDPGMEGNLLHEYLGHLRAGNSIYKLVCEADSEIGGEILSKLERERYNDITEHYRAENATDTTE
jgi:hypothetical protein